jgi:hypothetical protein
MFLERNFWLLKTRRVFALLYVKNLRAERGMPSAMRVMMRSRIGPRFEWPCLCFDDGDEKVMIPSIDGDEVAWLKKSIAQR